MAPLLLIAAVEIVSGGEARCKIDSDGSKTALFAAELVHRHIVLMTGVALPTTGMLPSLRFEKGPQKGYSIRIEGKAVLVRGQDLVRAAGEKISIVLIDSQGDLIRKVSSSALFNPEDDASLAERFILIDPSDIDTPPALNLFELAVKQ